MLSSIHIENIALISSLDIDFKGGFSAFTGETGAGKSIIIDSIGMALGDRSDRELIRSGEDKCAVEAFFTSLSKETLHKCAEFGVEPDKDGCIFVRRVLTCDGKSSVRINGRQVPLSILRGISGYLVNIHGQHHNGELLNSAYHIDLLDSYAENKSERLEYKKLYREYCELKDKLVSLSLDEKEKKRKIDILRFQVAEIKKAKLCPGEEEALEDEKKRLLNFEKISKNVRVAYDSLYGESGSAVEKLETAMGVVRSLSDIIPNGNDYLEQLKDFKYKILDIAELLNENASFSDEDPDMALDRIESRLDVISRLKMRYGSDIPEILSYLENCESELSEIELSDVLTNEIEEKLKKLSPQLSSSAKALSRSREVAGDKLSSLIMKEFEFLDMKDVKFSVNIVVDELSAKGYDKVEFLVSTNIGEPYKSLSKTASGGELARIMLAIKSVIAEKDSVETMIFDEIDTGVSGKTARKIGLKLLEISNERQVICVTHSAQIASLGDNHYFVSKSEIAGRNITDVCEISGDERIDEIARIISGMGVTESARATAIELMRR